MWASMWLASKVCGSQRVVYDTAALRKRMWGFRFCHECAAVHGAVSVGQQTVLGVAPTVFADFENAFPADAKFQQIFSQTVGVVAVFAFLTTHAVELPAGLRQRGGLSTNVEDELQLSTIEQVQCIQLFLIK